MQLSPLPAYHIEEILNAQQGVYTKDTAWLALMSAAQEPNPDEMQEQKMLKIEHNGCWFAFWGLLAAILVQCATGVFGFVRSYINYGKMAGSFATAFIMFMNTFVLCVIALSIALFCYKRKIWKDEDAPEE